MTDASSAAPRGRSRPQADPPAPEPESPADPVFAVIPVDGLRVPRGWIARTSPDVAGELILAGKARPATPAEVEIAEPRHVADLAKA